MPDAAALLLGIFYALEGREEALPRVHHLEVHAEVRAERPLDLLPLVQPQQPMIDENAGEPVADRPLNEAGGYGGVNAPRQAADRALLGAHGARNALHFLLDEVTGRPVRRAATHVEQKVVQNL